MLINNLTKTITIKAIKYNFLAIVIEISKTKNNLTSKQIIKLKVFVLIA